MRTSLDRSICGKTTVVGVAAVLTFPCPPRQGLKAFAETQLLPPDPYDIPPPLAARLIRLRDAALTPRPSIKRPTIAKIWDLSGGSDSTSHTHTH